VGWGSVLAGGLGAETQHAWGGGAGWGGVWGGVFCPLGDAPPLWWGGGVWGIRGWPSGWCVCVGCRRCVWGGGGGPTGGVELVRGGGAGGTVSVAPPCGGGADQWGGGGGGRGGGSPPGPGVDPVGVGGVGWGGGGGRAWGCVGGCSRVGGLCSRAGWWAGVWRLVWFGVGPPGVVGVGESGERHRVLP